MDDEEVRLITVTLLDFRAGVERLLTLLDEDEDGPGEEEEA